MARRGVPHLGVSSTGGERVISGTAVVAGAEAEAAGAGASFALQDVLRRPADEGRGAAWVDNRRARSSQEPLGAAAHPGRGCGH